MTYDNKIYVPYFRKLHRLPRTPRPIRYAPYRMVLSFYHEHYRRTCDQENLYYTFRESLEHSTDRTDIVVSGMIYKRRKPKKFYNFKATREILRGLGFDLR